MLSFDPARQDVHEGAVVDAMDSRPHNESPLASRKLLEEAAGFGTWEVRSAAWEAPPSPGKIRMVLLSLVRLLTRSVST